MNYNKELEFEIEDLNLLRESLLSQVQAIENKIQDLQILLH